MNAFNLHFKHLELCKYGVKKIKLTIIYVILIVNCNLMCDIVGQREHLW